jgi:hypothetical protein
MMLQVVFTLLALAAPASEADRLIDRGVDLREEGKDLEALELFQRAYEMNKSPRAMAQIGLAQQALGRWVDAEASLAKAIAESKHPWIKTRRAALESALAKVRERVGRVEILGTAGAQVAIDGRVAGTLPLTQPVSVVAGTIAVEVSGEGYLPVTRTVVVPAGGLARETIELVKKPADPPKVAVEQPPPGPKTSTSDPPKADVETVAPVDRGGGGSLTTVAFITGGAAVAAAGVGTTFLFVRNSHVSKYNDDNVCLAGGRTRDENCKGELDSANSARTVMLISFIGAAVLGGTTGLLFALDDGGDETSVALHCAPSAGSIGAFCSGRF